ncbi:iron compound ABC transporter permease [Bacillus thuringiensis serovar tolworthi]|uniref:Iron compound ABC transporter permease n=1 Tax=Bacillus thuringiensis subsp. tolworthi TaxID=1442 RepID=A0A9W3ZZN4_BACTO|nr:iron compound ABC transporter permease [Bacillus thuringiensis serovar tolworthi]
MELVFLIVIFIVLGQIVCTKMDLKHLEKRLDIYKEMLDIQNEKIDDLWRYINKC